MDIFNPDMGDVLDRVTILHLKLAWADEEHWRAELQACYQKLEGWNLPARILDQILELMAKNAAIFQVTDELNLARARASAKETLAEVLEVSQVRYARALEWNGERAELVRLLNSTLGRGAKREKV